MEKKASRLVQAGLRTNKEKCIFGVTELEFLGRKIKKDLILPTEEKAKSIEGYPVPTEVEGVRRFLGITNY